VDLISKGDIPPQIADTYHGEFNTIKDNLNTLIGAMNDITNAAEEIANGNLTVVMRERSAQDKLMQALSSMVRTHADRRDIRSIAGEVPQPASPSARHRSRYRRGPARSRFRGEASSSMEEMVSNIKQNADSAQQTDKIANSRPRTHRRAQVGTGSGVGDAGDCQQDLHH